MDQTGARNDHGTHAVFDFFAFEVRSSGAQVFDASVGAYEPISSVDF
jgi:hypothetical protein